ncbi:hypothetical protein ACM55F_04225 [Flavobacterium sp. XS2P12]|uniref:hypothetical protein n=1 Tax=Flavobacterium melibiosi TaxID=3398734 RepID=UPI003A89F81A
MDKEIKVDYLYGIDREFFLELENLGYDTEIPSELEKPPIYAFGSKPEDYIIVFSIYFSLKVVDELAKGIAEQLISNFTKIIKKIWKKHKDNKPIILHSGKEPEYKLPKAILTFKISENETSILEITNEINDSELEKLLETQLEVVKMQYKYRKEELKLEKKQMNKMLGN